MPNLDKYFLEVGTQSFYFSKAKMEECDQRD